MDHLESSIPDLRDELLTEALVNPTDELLVALRMLYALVKPLKILEGFDQSLVVFRGSVSVAALLDRLLDNKQGLPA